MYANPVKIYKKKLSEERFSLFLRETESLYNYHETQ